MMDFLPNSSLRLHYGVVSAWIQGGMKPRASIAFSEGDLRLAAQLCEEVRECIKLENAK